MTNHQEFGRSLKFYADWPNDPVMRTALHLQYVAARDGSLTLNMEIAPIPAASKQPLWNTKIVLQFTQSELVSLCSTLLGFRKTVRAAYHGSSRNKGFQIHSNPAKGALFAVSEKGSQLRHMLDQSGRAQAAAFVLSRLSESWELEPGVCLAILSNVETNIPTQCNAS